MQEARTQEIIREKQRLKADTFGGEQASKFQAELREFVENFPLYKRQPIDLPPHRYQFKLEVATLFCAICKGTRPFRSETPIKVDVRDIVGGKGPDYIDSGIYPIKLRCQDCQRLEFNCWVELHVSWIHGGSGSVRKVGQSPMWLPQISPEVRNELGNDTHLYLKALRNMNESYGIGACAYFRRLIEQYINPLLELLLEMKRESGESEEKLEEIADAIRAKDFTRKTAFAADIAPASLMVGGMNPLKRLHDLLSESIHVHDEDAAMDIAMQLQKTVEFVIRQLRIKYNEQKEYVAAMKELNKPKPAGGQ